MGGFFETSERGVKQLGAPCLGFAGIACVGWVSVLEVDERSRFYLQYVKMKTSKCLCMKTTLFS